MVSDWFDGAIIYLEYFGGIVKFKEINHLVIKYKTTRFLGQ